MVRGHASPHFKRAGRQKAGRQRLTPVEPNVAAPKSGVIVTVSGS